MAEGAGETDPGVAEVRDEEPGDPVEDEEREASAGKGESASGVWPS